MQDLHRPLANLSRRLCKGFACSILSKFANLQNHLFYMMISGTFFLQISSIAEIPESVDVTWAICGWRAATTTKWYIWYGTWRDHGGALAVQRSGIYLICDIEGSWGGEERRGANLSSNLTTPLWRVGNNWNTIPVHIKWILYINMHASFYAHGLLGRASQPAGKMWGDARTCSSQCNSPNRLKIIGNPMKSPQIQSKHYEIIEI